MKRKEKGEKKRSSGKASFDFCLMINGREEGRKAGAGASSLLSIKCFGEEKEREEGKEKGVRAHQHGAVSKTFFLEGREGGKGKRGPFAAWGAPVRFTGKEEEGGKGEKREAWPNGL